MNKMEMDIAHQNLSGLEINSNTKAHVWNSVRLVRRG